MKSPTEDLMFDNAEFLDVQEMGKMQRLYPFYSVEFIDQRGDFVASICLKKIQEKMGSLKTLYDIGYKFFICYSGRNCRVFYLGREIHILENGYGKFHRNKT